MTHFAYNIQIPTYEKKHFMLPFHMWKIDKISDNKNETLIKIKDGRLWYNDIFFRFH